MRPTIPFLLLATLSAAPLVVNGDFEAPFEIEKAGNQPGIWTFYTSGNATGRFTVEEGAGRNASRGVCFRRSETNYENNHLDQVLAVEPQKYYQVSAWIKGDGSANPLLAVLAMNWKLLGAMPAGAGNEWKKVSFVFASGTNTLVRLEWFPTAAGKLYSGGGAGSGSLDEVRVVAAEDLSTEEQRALTLTLPKPQEVDRSGLRPGPVGESRPLRPILATNGMLRYEDGGEVALWGVNFQTMLSWEYNGLLKNAGVPLEADALKKICDDSLDELLLMRTTVLRAHLLPGDFTDGEGRLTNTVFLDQLDYFLAACRKRQLRVYLTLLNQMGGKNPTFVPDSFAGKWNERYAMAFSDHGVPRAERYIRELLSRINPYTKTAYRDEPALSLLELVNEPDYFTLPELRADGGLASLKAEFEALCAKPGAGAPETVFPRFRYAVVKRRLDRLCAVVRESGAKQPILWNLNWPNFLSGREDVFTAAADSAVDAVSFCFYPGQGDTKSPYWANPTNLSEKNYFPKLAEHYREYDKLRWLLTERFAKKAKVVYEFETFYNWSSYLYPAFARLFRSLGAQSATMWTYRMMPAALYSGGSHYLNLRTTPEKALSALIAAEVMKRVPRYEPYDVEARETMRFGDFHLSFPENLGVFCDGTELVYTHSLTAFPMPVPNSVKRITGTGSSPLVKYSGNGAYFIRIEAASLEIEILPNVRFNKPPWLRDKTPICELDEIGSNPMTLTLPEWKGKVAVVKTSGSNASPVAVSAPAITFQASAGKYKITRRD